MEGLQLIDPTEETKKDEVPQKSKSAIKKELSKQRWLADKEKRKEKQKLKKKENKEKKRLEREANPEKFEKKNNHPRPEGFEAPKTNKQIKMEYRKLMQEGQPIIIDCSFHDWLKEKEMISLCRQIGYCHAANKKVGKPANIIVTGFSGKLKNQLIKMGGDNWGIQLLEKHYLDYYPKDKLVYLTGDATEDIEELDKETHYIIGGLVDHNRHKFATLNQANKEGLRVIRLPISQHVKLKSSTILSVNSVFDILLKVSNGEGWDTAIVSSIPSRKKEGEKTNKDEEEKIDDPESSVDSQLEEEGDKVEQENKDEATTGEKAQEGNGATVQKGETNGTDGANN